MFFKTFEKTKDLNNSYRIILYQQGGGMLKESPGSPHPQRKKPNRSHPRVATTLKCWGASLLMDGRFLLPCQDHVLGFKHLINQPHDQGVQGQATNSSWGGGGRSFKQLNLPRYSLEGQTIYAKIHLPIYFWASQVNASCKNNNK